MLTIEQRRKTDRKRRERWRKRKLAQGCKQIQLMMTPEAQAILEHESFTAQSLNLTRAFQSHLQKKIMHSP
jgi:hypothetical protein